MTPAQVEALIAEIEREIVPLKDKFSVTEDGEESEYLCGKMNGYRHAIEIVRRHAREETRDEKEQACLESMRGEQ